MKKKIAIMLLLTVMLTSCMAMLCACVNEEPEPREVELELINPTTGEVVQRDDVIDLPKEKTAIEVRIKDKETGEYLTDDDLPENTIKGSYRAIVWRIDNEEHLDYTLTSGYWPVEDDNVIAASRYYYRYEIVIYFECRPENPENPREFQRRYKHTQYSVRFYSSKFFDDRYHI